VQTIDLDEVVRLDRRTVLASEVVARACTDLTKPTPCADWNLGELLAHMTVQHLGFARAARGEVTAAADWQPRPLADAFGDYVDACAVVLAGFATVTDPAAPVLLPEIRVEPVPAQVAIGFHLLDYVVHTWDLAASLGSRPTFADDVLAVALATARQVPDGEARDRPDAAFAHALPVPPGASPFDEILLLVGRDPAWLPA
jgi:uncharacterized protein (TIGR03086 family)